MITASSSARACSTRSSRRSIDRANRAWLVSKCPVNACARSGILRRILPFARSASRNGSDSPLIIAVRIALADTVFRLDATDDNLIEASSNINSNRTISRARSPISCTRYRVNIRSRRISGGGTNDGAEQPVL